MKNLSTIKVANIAQKVLLDTELLGQFSDGFWENSRNTSWRYLDEVKIANDTETVGVYFQSEKPYDYKGYSVNNLELLSYVGDRMLSKARVARFLNIDTLGEAEGLFETYTVESKIIKGEEITLEDFENQIDKWNSESSPFWEKRAKVCIEFLRMHGTQNVLEAINDTSYGMKEMRKDLTAITKLLKIAE